MQKEAEIISVYHQVQFGLTRTPEFELVGEELRVRIWAKKLETDK